MRSRPTLREFLTNTTASFASASIASTDGAQKVHVASELAPGTPFIVLGNNVELGRATVGANGKATVTLVAAPNPGVTITYSSIRLGVVVPVPPAPVETAPTRIMLSNRIVPTTALLGSDIGFFTTDTPTPVKFTITNSAGGYVSHSGRRLRLEKNAANATITVKAENSAGSCTETFNLTTLAPSFPAGAIARWDTKDAAKYALNSTTPTKVQTWTDVISGFVLEGGTTQPTLDTTNKMNGYPTVSASAGATMVQMKALGSNPANAALVALLNNPDAPYTIMAVVDEPTLLPTQARELLSFGSSALGRNYFLWRHATNVAGYALLRGDNTAALAATASSNVATTAGKGILSIRSDGTTFNQNFNKSDGNAANATADGTATGDVMSLFNRAVGGAAGNNWDGRIAALMIWPRKLNLSETNLAVDLLAAEFGVNTGDAPVFINLDDYNMTASDDFDGTTTPWNLNPATDLTNPSGYLPYYLLSGRNEYGSPSALANEKGWYGDVRHPRIAPYRDQLIKVVDGVVEFGAIPMPAELSDLPLIMGDGKRATHLCGALISMGLPQFMKQYCYIETRVKHDLPGLGRCAADWAQPISTRWPTEIDNHEQLSETDDGQRAFNLHSDPYFPEYGGQSQDHKMPVYIAVPSKSANYALYGFEVTATDINIYHNRKFVGKVSPYAGMRTITITNGGAGIVPDGATVAGAGTLRLRLPSTWATDGSSTDGIIDCVLDANGTITSAAITKPGTRPGGTPVRVTAKGTGASATTAIEGTTPPVFAFTYCDDPNLPTAYHVPFYLMWAMQMWVNAQPNDSCKMWLDYVRVYEPKRVSPNFSTGALGSFATTSAYQTEAQAVFDRAAALSKPFTTAQKNTANDLIRFLKGWKLRGDTKPMGYHTSDWDVSKLSLWDALSDLLIAGSLPTGIEQALINWKKPGASTDFTKIGNPTWSAAGLAMTANDGVQGPVLDVNDLVRGWDCHLGIHAVNMAQTASLQRLIGSGTNLGLLSSLTTHEARLMHGSGMISAGQNALTLPEAHLTANRGWRYQANVYKGGDVVRGGYYASQTFTTTGVSNLIIGQGMPMTVKKAHAGRRLMIEESGKLAEILAGI